MYQKQLKGFPAEVVGKMLERQFEQGNPKDAKVFERVLNSDQDSKGFKWALTEEGHSFWERVIMGKDFDYFFKTYPLKFPIYNGQLSGFPEEIVEKLLERQVEQKNPRNIGVFESDITNGQPRGGMDWELTSEGSSFWNNVLTEREFDLFFKKYPVDKSPEAVKRRLSRCLQQCANELQELKHSLFI